METESGNRKAQSAVITQLQRKQDEFASLINIPSHVVNIDKNNMLI